MPSTTEEKTKVEKVKACPQKQKLSLPAGIQPQVTLTAPTPTEADRCRSHDDIHSAFHMSYSAQPAGLQADKMNGQAAQPWTHESLRATRSDPHHLYCENPINGGHLGLAKTLSDEGAPAKAKLAHKESLSSRESSQDEDSSWPQPAMLHGSKPQLAARKSHPKLARQLSLKGHEDPRWQKQAQGARQQPLPTQHPQPVIQAGNQHTAIHRSASENTCSSKNVKWKFHEPLRPANSHSLQKQAAYNQFCSGFVLPDVSQPPPGVKLALTRLGSAPGIMNCRPADPVAKPRPPRMTRQNSCSDSQLNVYQDERMDHIHPYNIPPNLSYEQAGNLPWTRPFDELQAQMQGQMSPASVQTFQDYQGHGQETGLRDSFHHPSHEQVGLCVLNSGPVYYSPSQNIPDPRQTNIPANLARSFSPPGLLGPPGGQMGMHPGGQLSPGGQMHSGAQLHMAPPTSQTLGPEVADSRQALYFHLCGLFDKGKVERAMAEHPNITDGPSLCKIIINMSD